MNETITADGTVVKPKPSWHRLTPDDIETLLFPPYLVFTDNLNSWLSAKIKRHTNGDYSHCFWYLGGDVAVSQDWIYHKVNMRKKYLQGKHRVKVWKVKHEGGYGWPDSMINAHIKRRLNRGFFSKLYDLKGIIGQWLGVRSIQSPWRKFCSESVGDAIRAPVTGFNIYKPNPSEINKFCEANADEFHCIGVYDPGSA